MTDSSALNSPAGVPADAVTFTAPAGKPVSSEDGMNSTDDQFNHDDELSPDEGPPAGNDHGNSLGRRAVGFLFEYSLFLIAGAVIALVWANYDNRTYSHFIHFELKHLFVDQEEEHGESAATDAAASVSDVSAAESEAAQVGAAAHGEDGHAHPLDLAFLVNDVLMAFFFAIAAKEVWEALLPGGPLSNPRKAATPLLATLGGIVGPATLYLTGAVMLGQMDQLGDGWAIPCATDIAFSYLVARLIFGAGHPAIAFLLLLAIADDAAGLAILAVFYPSGDLALHWLLLTVAAVGIGFVLRKLRLQNFWWYLAIPGTMSWFSFYWAGIHPALGLVPIIPCMPHAHTDLGIFARRELRRHDTLNEFEHWWKPKVEVILGLFGLVNAGVVLSNFGAGTWLVLVGLLVGKPLGITLFTWIGERLLGLEIPGNMNYRHIVSLGLVAGIGFTVALFVSTAAFTEPGPIQDSVKMGALASFLAAGVAFVVARLLGVRPEKRPQAAAA